ncbi:hypothetical protein BDZ89DRAFT_1136648 [Hymenopellis radicata]|nr:hypothetical protein BDZ89DRAFT_1136648 [Hymenopellis radicata]
MATSWMSSTSNKHGYYPVSSTCTLTCVMGTTDENSLKASVQLWPRSLDGPNVLTPFWLIREAALYFRVKHLLDIRLHGNISQVNYAAAKAAVVSLIKTIAKLMVVKEYGMVIEIDGKKVALRVRSAKFSLFRVHDVIDSIPYIY